MPKTTPVRMDVPAVTASTRRSTPRKARGRQTHEQPDQPAHRDDAQAAADERERHALGEQLPQQARPARAHRDAHGQLALARHQAREEQVRHVDARDEQHEPRRAQQHEQRATGVADEDLVERADRRAMGMVPKRRQPGAERFHLGPRLLERHVRLEARDHPHEVVAARRLVEGPRERQPELGALRVVEARRHDARYRVRLAVERHALTDERGIGPEPLPPQPVGQHDGLRAAGLILFGRERTAHARRDAQHREPRRGDRRAADARRVARAGQHDAARRRAADRRKHLALVPPVHVDGKGGRRARHLGLHVEHHDEPVGVGEGQRLEQHGVDRAEHRGVGADAKGQGEGRRGREAGVLDQGANAEPEILPEAVHHLTSRPRRRQTVRGCHAPLEGDSCQGRGSGPDRENGTTRPDSSQRRDAAVA